MACWLELQCFNRVTPSFQDIDFDPEVFSGALRQGGRDGPFGFNIFMRWLFHKLHECWTSEARGWGVKGGGGEATCLSRGSVREKTIERRWPVSNLTRSSDWNQIGGELQLGWQLEQERGSRNHVTGDTTM